MNFIDYIKDQQRNLPSTNYVEMLWGKLTGSCLVASATLEDEEVYAGHIPVEFTKFLKKCVAKLRDLKINGEEVDWQQVDRKYLSTLIYFAMLQEDVTMDNALYASNIFFLFNTINGGEQQFFSKVVYLKIMETLKEFNRSQDITNTAIMFLMDDFKTYLSKVALPEDVVIPTVSVLHDYTYCCNDAFESFVTDISFENLGYIAFVSLKVLVDHLSQHKNNDKKLFPIVLALTSSLKSGATDILSRTVKVSHQRNVRLFIRQNSNKFATKSFCLVTDMLKFVCLNSEYDDYDAIAQLIQELSSEAHKTFLTFFQNSLVCDDVEFRKNALNMVLPILRYPAKHETNSKRLVRTEIFMGSILKLCADSVHEVREKALRIIAEYSDNSVGQQVLQKIMAKDNYEINRDIVIDILHEIVDMNWRKKMVNVNYIHLMCNLLIIQEDLITIKTLNKFRHVCLLANPNDLKPCIPHLKRFLKSHAGNANVVLYVLSVFVRQMLHPMSTSAVFAKELHEFIFTNISLNEEDRYIWNVVNYLISSNFDVLAVFERFKSMGLLRYVGNKFCIQLSQSMGARRENHNGIQNSRKPYTHALKLLCIMLHFVKYKECHCLDEKLERSLTSDTVAMSDTDLYLVIYALTKILEKRSCAECSVADLNNYRQMQHLVSRAFFDQVLPIACIKYVVILLSEYSRILAEDSSWDEAACNDFQEDLTAKLEQVLERKLEHPAYLSRDVVYIAELVILRQTSFSEHNFRLLKKIVSPKGYTVQFLDYLKKNQEIWALCVLLYTKVCFVNPELVPECVANLEMTMVNANDYLKLQTMYGLLDVCNMHLQYYDPLVPHLFTALYSKNAYIRFISAKIIMQLTADEQLRLMDGQYFLFMGLLADEKEIIARNVEVFVKDKFAEKYCQTIARYFVPSIIHYNLYYEHPAIALSQADQDLLKKRIYSWNDRSFIYYCLYQYLPENLKFKILNQISVEILERVLNKNIPHSAEVFRILEDALAVILYIVPKDQIGNVQDDREFYETQMKHMENDLLVRDYKNSELGVSVQHRVVLKNVLTALFHLLYSEINNNPGICQNLLFTIIALTKMYYSAIKHIINEECSALKQLYKELRQFYVKMKHQFEYCLLTVNPCNLAASSEKEDTEFYLHEFSHFSLVPSHVIMGVED